MKKRISKKNWKVCDELFEAVLKGTEGMGQTFSYTIRPDMGCDQEDPNDLKVHYDLIIYEQYHEVVGGGPHDGAEGYFGFHTDLGWLLDLLKPNNDRKQPDICFGASLHTEEDPCVNISGSYKGRDFTVTLRAYPPDDAKGDMKIDHSRGTYEY